jgi:hypothetical protein
VSFNIVAAISNKGLKVMKTLVVLFMFIFITGCASLGGTYDKEKVQKVKKIALIGFSYDAPLETGDHMVSALMGNEQSSGPGMMAGQKWEKILPETPYSKEVYDQLVAGLKKDGRQEKRRECIAEFRCAQNDHRPFRVEGSRLSPICCKTLLGMGCS